MEPNRNNSMRRKTETYLDLYLSSVAIEEKLLKKQIVDSLHGRFKDYQRESKKLGERFKGKSGLKKGPTGPQIVALKELKELVAILGRLLVVYDDLPKRSQEIVKEKISTILKGSSLISDEGRSTVARDIQFELRFAATLIDAAFIPFFYKNPDIAVEVKGKRYSFECKRITGTSPRSVQSNIEQAIDQLLLARKYFYAGVVVLDVSSLIDKRKNLLTTRDQLSALNRVSRDLEVMIKRDYDRYWKLKRAAKHVVAMIYNHSGAYVIKSTGEIGWIQYNILLILSKENIVKGNRFEKDFSRMKEIK